MSCGGAAMYSRRFWDRWPFLAIACISCLIWSHSGLSQTPTASNSRVQLVVKSGFPNFGVGGEVLFRSDERFVALHGSGIVIVFDLRLHYEVRRIALMSRSGTELFVSPLSQQLAFSNHSDSLYVREGEKILECDLLNDDPCLSIVDDAASGIVVSADDKLAYINSDGTPIVLHPRDTTPKSVLPQTVAPADKEDFSWRVLRFDEQSGHAEQLAVVGEIDRKSTVEDAHHHKKEATREDWRMSSFEIGTGRVINNYANVPLSVSSVAYDANGRLLLCGSLLSEADNLDAPERVFDTSTHSFTAKRPAPFGDGCLKASGVKPIDKSWLTPRLPPSEQIDSVWGSPNGDLVIYSTKALDGRNGLYLVSPKNQADVQPLTGHVAPIESIEFLQKHPILASRFVNSYLWDFAGGTMLTWAWYTHFSADGKIAAAFVPNANQTWDLTFWSLPELHATLPGVQLKKAPEWFGLSENGETVAVLEKRRLSFYRKGGETDLSCTSNDFGQVGRQKPVINAAGTKMVALCDRDENNPSEDGLSAYLIVWDLESLAETRIPAEDSDRYFAIAWDDSAFLVGNGSRFRLINAKTLQATKFRSKSPYEIIDGVAFRPDGSSAVLAVTNFQSSAGKLLFIDLKTGKSLGSSVEPSEIKSIAYNSNGYLAVLLTSDTISIYGPQNSRLIRLIAAGPYDWIALSESGFFDGTAGALRWVGYRLKGADSPVNTIDTLFNELYSPGLLLNVFQGQGPELPTGINISTYLEIPGLRLLLQQGDLRATLNKNRKAVLCMERESLFQALRYRGSAVSPTDDPHCRFEAIPSDQENPTLLVKALNDLASSKLTTPWDAGQISANANTVHVLTAAVGKYADSKDFPEIPTAVSSVRKLQRVLLEHSAGDNVHIWNQEGCGTALEDQDATKANVLHCIDLIVQQAKPDDLVILTFAGHGGPDTKENELFYFYPYDARTAGQDSGAISSAELADKLRFLQAKRLVLIMDSCESGAAMQPLEAVVEAKIRIASLSPSQQPAGGPSEGPNEQGALLIAASSGIETATSTTAQNPFFDRLIALLSDYQATNARTWAHAVGAKMKEPSSVELAPSGTHYLIQPFVLAIGADFPITRSKH
jgi:Caspase domain